MNKKLGTITIFLILIMSMFVSAEIVTYDEDQQFDEYDTQLKISFWKSLFGARLSFIDEKVDDLAYERDTLGIRDSRYYPSSGLLYYTDSSVAGYSCNVGEVIAPYVVNADASWDYDFFVYGFVKTYSNENLKISNYKYLWNAKALANPPTKYAYACFSAEEDDREYSSDRCMNSVELCDNPYQYFGSGNYFCDLGDVENCDNGCSAGECVENDVNTVGITLQNVRLSDSVVTEEQTYEIKGDMIIRGTCDDCVIESGLYYAESSQYSLIVDGEGACGDALTVGAKFDGEEEKISFVLSEKAIRSPGTYTIPINVFNGCWADIGNDMRLLDSYEVKLTIEERPPVQEALECFYCDGTTKTSRTTYDTSCKSGEEIESALLSCQVAPVNPPEVLPDITCWSCNGEIAESQELSMTACPPGLRSTEPDCTTPVVPDCSNTPGLEGCESGDDEETFPEYSTCCDLGDAEYWVEKGTCPVGQSVDASACETVMQSEFKEWFDQNTEIAIAIMVLSVMIIVGIVVLLTTNKK